MSEVAGFLGQVRSDHPEYHARPVSPFGAEDPHLLIGRPGPGMHGANRTGRRLLAILGILCIDVA